MARGAPPFSRFAREGGEFDFLYGAKKTALMLEPHLHPPPFNHLSAPTRISISKGPDFTGCGKTASDVGFGWRSASALR
jgi:hypothetical protein